MIELMRGNILEADAEAIVNTVNCIGVMGKGLALQFKKAHPANFEAYREACTAGEVQPGRMFVHATGRMYNPKYIINFPTKRHWRDSSHYEDIEAGLTSLIEEARRLDISTIAVPPLGCGLGGLDWAKVRPMIEAAFAELPGVQVFLFETGPTWMKGLHVHVVEIQLTDNEREYPNEYTEVERPMLVQLAAPKSWGSCGKDGMLHFHWRVILLPPVRIEYLVLHELCHLHEHDHSDAFYERLRRASPDYRAHDAWLRAHGDDYGL